MVGELGTDPLVDPGASVLRSRLGSYTEVGERTKLVEVDLGDYSYVANDSDLIYTQLGKFCSVASHVRINPGNHPMQRASQSHFTYRASRYFPDAEDEQSFFSWRRSHGVTIGHDVWIGHGAVVLPGRAIGTGAVVGAGSIVTRDVAPYTIVVGNPARLVRRRFEPEIAEGMERLAWWDWSHDELRAALDDFRRLPAEAFIAKYRDMAYSRAERHPLNDTEAARLVVLPKKC